MHKIKFIPILAATAITIGSLNLPTTGTVHAESCPDLGIIFARGSGGTLNEDSNYLEWKNSIAEKLQTTSLSYTFTDLDYPAVAVGLDNLETSIGALASGGDAYIFGESVNTGVQKLVTTINSSACSDTKYVIGGYSQGAMVISKSLSQLNSDKIIYAATFGDPKIYLPEGAGLIPDACKNKNLSDYRMYVPDCHAYEGLLGSIQPYEPEDFIGKLGTWCNKSDIFCSSHLNISDHLNYVADALYQDAAKVIFDKITEHFNLQNTFTSLHNTAILIDSTGSMASMIDKYKAEALRLAKATLDSGGRVALYDYRDLSDPYEPVEHCSFTTCTLEIFETELSKIETHNGGDTPESLLSASLKVMNEQTWQYGATKSVVVLTDADFLSPDRDGATLDQVIKLSKSIDPVNFYIITNSDYSDDYTELTLATDGQIFTNFNELNLSTDFIMARYDSLPRVEESSDTVAEPATIAIDSVEISENSATVTFTTTGNQTMVILNDYIVWLTSKNQITLDNLTPGTANQLRLIPYLNENRGIATEKSIITKTTTIPKAPDTGQASPLVL